MRGAHHPGTAGRPSVAVVSLTALVLATSLLLAGCGDRETTPTPRPTSTPASTPAAATGTPVHTMHLVVEPYRGDFGPLPELGGAVVDVATGATSGRYCFDPRRARWWPDGSGFGFLCFVSNSEMVVGQARLQGERVEVEQAYLLRGVQARPGGMSWFIYPQDWAPDGRRLLVSAHSPPVPPDTATPAPAAGETEGELYVFDARSGAVQLVFSAPGRVRGEWSPRGDRIAVARLLGFDARLRAQGAEVVIIRADGSEPVVVRGPEGEDLYFDLACHAPLWMRCWSPDGSMLIVKGARTALTLGALYVVRADGTGLRQVSQDGMAFAGWSPDGRAVLVTAPTGDIYDWDILLLSPDGGAPRRVGRGLMPAWSPDGRGVAYDSGPCIERSVTRFDVATGRSTALSGPLGALIQLAWSPRGDVIAVSVIARPETSAVYLVQADGSGVRKLRVATSRLLWSPRGTHLLVAPYVGDHCVYD